jgi:branched-chain amino acid transport system substrate-binding protein
MKVMMNRYLKIGWVVYFFLSTLLWSGNVIGAAAGENQVGSFAVAYVLPLTGEYGPYGNKVLDAIKLAVGASGPNGNRSIALIVEDSKSNPKIARQAVLRLAQRKDVICILGPLGSNESLDAAKEAQKQHIPMVTLTQKEGITDIGDYVFRHFLTRPTQIKGLVQYAVVDMGLKRFAILYPDDYYGREMEQLFRTEALSRGGMIVQAKSYKTAETDFGDEIKMITGAKVTPGAEPEDSHEVFKPVIDFDALFIPDSYTKINMIVPQLIFYNVKGFRLLGVSGWNSPELLKGSGEYAEGALFVDGFSKNSFYREAQDFIDRFYIAYSREPDMLEALAYDAAAIVTGIVRDGQFETRDQFRDRLLQVKDFRGATGKTSFAGMRDARKDVFFLMVKDGDIRQIR